MVEAKAKFKTGPGAGVVGSLAVGNGEVMGVTLTE